MELSPDDKKIFKRMTDSGFQRYGITYLKELVTVIYEHQNGNPVVHYSELDDRRTWKEAFFSDRDGGHLLWEAIPLTRNGNHYRFIHKSLLEYGLSLAVFGPSQRNDDTEAMSSESQRGNTSSVFRFESLSSKERTAAFDESLLDSPLGKRDLVGERSILEFLTERAQREPVFKDQLHSVIERSKTDKAAQTAAANAITILVRARVQFNNADLRNIRIPGADLSSGMFDSAQLEGADLRKVNLRNIWMRQANLRGAQMTGVQFGELPFLEEDSAVVCGAYSPDGKTYAAGLEDGSISLYETSDWNRMQRLECHSDWVDSLSFSATGDQIASGSYDSTVRVWDVDTRECVHTLQGHSDQVQSVVYSPKGDWIASGSDDGTGHSGEVEIVVYSPKGDQTASGSDDSTVRVWDVDSGECIHTLKGHNGYVNSVVYSPKGDRIASRSYDSTVRVWDVNTGECVHTLQGYGWSIKSVVYSPKGDRVVSGSADQTMKLWSAETGQCQATILGFSSFVSSIAFEGDADALRLVTGSWDKSVRCWRITKEGVEHKAVLCWSSSHVLTVHDLSFEDVQGLSRLNRELLIQRGALIPSPLPSGREGVEKNETPFQVSIIYSSAKHPHGPPISGGFPARSKRARRSGSETLTVLKPKRRRPSRLSKSMVIDDESSSTSSGEESEKEASSSSRIKKGRSVRKQESEHRR
ncbi:hypothetical protein BGZ80_000087 [Entomortierella chlamydospora]|uniref:WD40 repeat-like protein n=1 Tax=Entomortierella chlamydospora TaxID=101097 RepID=A0A9P6MT86_9FUNG|nr:hypothetical protein BGZ80_000087 [Entomortierella chlamydospora]